MKVSPPRHPGEQRATPLAPNSLKGSLNSERLDFSTFWNVNRSRSRTKNSSLPISTIAVTCERENHDRPEVQVGQMQAFQVEGGCRGVGCCQEHRRAYAPRGEALRGATYSSIEAHGKDASWGGGRRLMEGSQHRGRRPIA